MQLFDEPKLTIYNSSAGSGKTYTLATEFIRFALLDDQNFRRVLAITFTNKATAEMKQRILKFLHSLKSGSDSSLMSMMKEKTGLTESEIKRRSSLVLTNVLHNYSFFSVNTIDSFFQRLIKSFAAELNIYINYELILDPEEVVNWVVDEMIERSSNDKKLQQWIQKYVTYKMDNDSSIFNIKDVFNSISKDIFNNHLKDKLEYNYDVISDFTQVESLLTNLSKTVSQFEKQMNEFSKKGMDIYNKNNLSVNDFSYKASGVGSVFEKINIKNKNYDFGARVIAANENPEKWLSKDGKSLLSIVENDLAPLLNDILEYNEQHVEEYLTAKEVIRNIYAFGITNYLEKLKEEYVQDNNLLLLSDSSGHISELIKEQEDSPFLYDKIGTYYRYILLDESQDTSQTQWKNLLPLVQNCLSEGGEVVVVGDVKQSIYRWRGGDVQLLVNGIKEDVYPFTVNQKNLNTNYRSAKTIIDANNLVLKNCLDVLKNVGHQKLEDYYDAYIQNAHQDFLGYVNYQKIISDKDFQEQSLDRTLEKINNLVDVQGFEFKDITIIVRKNSESAIVAEFLKLHNIPVLSSEALYIQNSEEVKFIISILKILDNDHDDVAKGVVINYLEKDFNNVKNSFYDALPQEFNTRIEELSNLDTYSAVESIISIFQLEQKSTAYLVELLNLILDYAVKHTTSIHSFVQYWEEKLADGNHSINVPEGENAVNIVSIHKSKGLEFPVVIIPFANWKMTPHNSSLFWFQREKEKEDTLFFPVNYSKRLAETDFKIQFSDELFLNILDALNELYVALTRASKELHVFIDEPRKKSKDKEINNISSLLLSALNGLFDDNGIWESGGPVENHQNIEGKHNTITLDRIDVGQKSAEINLLSRDEDEAREEGKLLHKLLENIESKEDIPREVQRILLAGEANKEKTEHYVEIMHNVLQIDKYASLISGAYTVIDEMDIYSSLDQRMYRPDKIFIKDKNAVIVDFKSRYSESAESKYKRQLLTYKKLLLEMGYNQVELYLLYIEEANMIGVN